MGTVRRKVSRGDQIGIAIFMIFGAGIVAFTAVAAILRISTIAAGKPVGLLAQFVDAPAKIALGSGAKLEVQVESATAQVQSLPGSAVGLAIAEPVTMLVTVAVVVTCLTLVAYRILQGSVFGRMQTRCLTIAGLTGLVGFGLAPVFGNLAAHEALESVTRDRTLFAAFAISPFPFILSGFVIGIVITAFTVGERMQRDQEGLV